MTYSLSLPLVLATTVVTGCTEYAMRGYTTHADMVAADQARAIYHRQMELRYRCVVLGDVSACPVVPMQSIHHN